MAQGREVVVALGIEGVVGREGKTFEDGLHDKKGFHSDGPEGLCPKPMGPSKGARMRIN